MKTPAQKIKELKKTPYEITATRGGVSVDYVNKIATGLKKTSSKKGQEVLDALEQYIEELKEE